MKISHEMKSDLLIIIIFIKTCLANQIDFAPKIFFKYNLNYVLLKFTSTLYKGNLNLFVLKSFL